MENIKIRPPKQEDSAFIVTSWASSAKKLLDQSIPSDVHYDYYKPLIIKLLESKPKIIIAASKDDDDHILGYTIVHQDVLQYMYVKYVVRRQGIAKMMYDLVGKPKIISHKPVWWHKYLANDRLVYNPYLFLGA